MARLGRHVALPIPDSGALPVTRASRALRRLSAVFSEYGEGCAAEKLALLASLEKAALPSAAAVRRLHELLCFLRAYPDDARVRARVLSLLARFSKRRDLRRFKKVLVNTGIAGTEIRSRFFHPVAVRLVRLHAKELRIDWPAFEERARLEPLLPLLTHFAESPALDEVDLSVRRWIETLKGPGETDAAFLLRRFEALHMSAAAREKIYDELDPPLVLVAGPETPSRTHEEHPGLPVAFQSRPLARGRPDLSRELRRPPRRIRPVSRSEGESLVELARDAMLCRDRDLDIFSYGDPDDVRLVEFDDGLCFACIGAIPERRLLLEAVYGFLTLKNGVPIGYVLSSALYRSSEVAYNVFESFRGGEAGLVYGRVLSMLRHLFGSDHFTIYPYQLGGQGNEEGLRSGAFWFYQKLGFRPRDPATLSLMRQEERRMRRDPAHRSGRDVLEHLARNNVFWSTGGRSRRDVIGTLSFSALGLRVSRFLTRRFGSDRERAGRECSRIAARRLGLSSRSTTRLRAGERLAWERWAPLLAMLPGLERWRSDERRALFEVVRAKGGHRESDYVRRFDAHARLRRAVARLARDEALDERE